MKFLLTTFAVLLAPGTTSAGEKLPVFKASRLRPPSKEKISFEGKHEITLYGFRVSFQLPKGLTASGGEDGDSLTVYSEELKDRSCVVIGDYQQFGEDVENKRCMQAFLYLGTATPQHFDVPKVVSKNHQPFETILHPYARCSFNGKPATGFVYKATAEGKTWQPRILRVEVDPERKYALNILFSSILHEKESKEEAARLNEVESELLAMIASIKIEPVKPKKKK